MYLCLNVEQCKALIECFLSAESEQWKAVETKPLQNIVRWMSLIEMQPCVVAVLNELPAEVRKAADDKNARKEEKAGGRKEEGKFVDLPGAEIGKVVVRFPPEASG